MHHRRITPYIHEYEFPYHDYLLSHYDYFDQIYNESYKNHHSVSIANVGLPISPITEFLTSKLEDLVTQNYHVSPPFKDCEINIYKQTQKDFISVSHNHVDISDIIGVFYLNPPKTGEGGEIKFHNPVYNNNPIIIQPRPNRLYLFPSWMYHLPLPQKTNTPRFSFNWGYTSSISPIHKISADRW